MLSYKKRKTIKEIVAEKTKKIEKDLKEKISAENNKKKDYPPLIATILKRLKRIDPWTGVTSFDKYDSVLISFFKLKQRDITKLRIGVNSLHIWVEFFYDEKWWIFDPMAVKNLKLGDPVKPKSDATEIEYTSMTIYYTDVDNYIEKYENKLSFSKDEAKIEAMKDENLSSVLKIKYH